MLKQLKDRIFGGNSSTPTRQPAQPIEHEILGALTPDPNQLHVLVGRIEQDGLTLEVRISTDDGTLGEAIALAASAKQELSRLDAKARMLVANECLEGYNSDWRFGEEVLPDGTRESFEKPLLSKQEFCSNLRFEALDVSGKSCLTFWYDDNDMFWGHSLSVTSFSGTNLENSYASMSG